MNVPLLCIRIMIPITVRNYRHLVMPLPLDLRLIPVTVLTFPCVYVLLRLLSDMAASGYVYAIQSNSWLTVTRTSGKSHTRLSGACSLVCVSDAVCVNVAVRICLTQNVWATWLYSWFTELSKSTRHLDFIVNGLIGTETTVFIPSSSSSSSCCYLPGVSQFLGSNIIYILRFNCIVICIKY